MATWEGTFLNGRYRIDLVAERFGPCMRPVRYSSKNILRPKKKRSLEHSNLRTKIVFEAFYRSTAHRLQQRKPAPLASGGSFSYQVYELRRP